MSIDYQEAARAYHRNKEPYRKRNAEIAAKAHIWGEVTRLAKKYGITPQRVSQIAQRERSRT